MKILLLLCVISTTLSCASQSNPGAKQSNGIAHTIGKAAETLPDRVWKVFQDSKGTYWFGSNGQGVFTYDGEALVQLTTEDGLVDNTIRGFQEDIAGDVFIETPSGISKYDGKSLTTLEVVRSPENQWTLSPDDLWFGYNANQVRRYDGKTLFELKLPEQDIKAALGIDANTLLNQQASPYSIFGINKDKAGNVWFGTMLAGAFRFDGSSFLWVGEPELTIRSDGSVPGVRVMLEDADGNMWLSNGLNKYNIKAGQNSDYTKLPGLTTSWPTSSDSVAYFNAGMVDTAGHLWMIEYGGSIWKYDGKTLVRFPVSDGNMEVLTISIYQDRQGEIWLGTDNDGVYRFDGTTFKKFKPALNR
ncbi:MAG: two-component regulator propeller domain-containing protein [Saprospiraceae bacterium]